ncbi:helix-turn-helix domain-containing protein [Streptomyces phaeochromogenes]|uniref:helix-turn-helix domain-containing protein n=1 Tax=Streptomyces phaeochromogenes TaxID=1923 RepID=UPI00369F2BB6
MDNALREQLTNGTFRPGDVLPPQRCLASDYGVSRDTVQQVLRQLAAEGWIESRQGSGSRVVRLPSADPASPGTERRGRALLLPLMDAAFQKPTVSLDVFTLTPEALARHLRHQTERASNMVHATMADLSPAGVEAAHGSLIELAKAVALHRFDDVEPRLAPALAQAAKDLANGQLADPELSPPMLARQLNVSVRTLQRTFATTGESATAYIRHRRLEEARLALTTPSGRLSVSELAAHWQFADSSHFIRAFKKRYGQTPTEYARSTRPAGS